MSLILNALKSVPISDWYTSLVAIVIIAFLLLSVELGLKYFSLPSLYTRKIVHILTGLIICVVAFILSSNIPIILFASSYLLLDLWSLRKGKFKSIHPDSRSFGTFFYAISVIILAILFWNNNKPLFIITNLIMIIPDAMAALIGDRYARNYFVPVNEKKSIIGALTMFFFTLMIVFLSLEFFYDKSLAIKVIIAVIVAAVATVSELLSIRGSDNLSVPLFSGLFLYTLLIVVNTDMMMVMVFGLILAAFVSILSFNLKFLNVGGAALAFLMGSIIFGFGGWAYAIPILCFFILSSILSKIGKSKKKQIESSYQKTGIRDFQQAFANGGVATVVTLIAFFTGNDAFYYVYIASLAAATADTWGTELGIFSRSKPVLITNFNTVEPGTSGGITPMGSIAGFLGSAVIVSLAFLFNQLSIQYFLFITLAGFTGSVIDSILGATIQGHYKCSICGQITESKTHCQKDTTLINGKDWIDNDIVNIFSICVSSFITYIFLFN